MNEQLKEKFTKAKETAKVKAIEVKDASKKWAGEHKDIVKAGVGILVLGMVSKISYKAGANDQYNAIEDDIKRAHLKHPHEVEAFLDCVADVENDCIDNKRK